MTQGPCCVYKHCLCASRKCSKCGTASIKVTYAPDVTAHIAYEEWGQEANRFALITKKATPGDLFQLLLQDVYALASHLTNAYWETNQLKLLSAKPPKGFLVSVLDYAENYTCVPQNEVQSAHCSLYRPHSIPLYSSTEVWTELLSAIPLRYIR